jgi:Tfp pilus assembly protein PilF
MAHKHQISLAILIAVAACGGPQIDRKRSNTRYDLAVDFLRNGKFDQAEKEARKALEYNPTNAEAFNVIGLVHLFRGINNLTLVEVQNCLTGVDAEGLRLEMDEHLGKARKSFAKAHELDGEYGEAWANEGVVALNQEDYSKALGLFQKGLEFPTRLTSTSVTRANLGWAYFKSGDMVRAAKELRQASQFQPGMCLASYRLGRVYFERKEWEKALEKFREVALQEAQCPIQEAHLYLAKSYQQLGMTSEIQRTIDSCVKMAPKSCLANQCRALAAEANRPVADR